MKSIPVILFFVCCLNFLSAQTSNADVFVKAKNALVHITSFDSKGDIVAEGNGFFFNSQGMLLTLTHLVKDFDSIKIQDCNGIYYSVKKVEVVNEKAGIAVVHIYKKAGQVSAVSLSESVLYEGDSVFTIASDSKLQALVSQGYTSVIRMFESSYPGLLCMIHVDKLHDGAPLFNYLGEVIGIFSYPKIESFNLNFALSIKSVTESEVYKSAKKTVKSVTEQVDNEQFRKENDKIILSESIVFDSIISMEARLKRLGDSIIDGMTEFSRLDALTDFIPLFVKTLKIRGSYFYDFNKLDFMYKLVAPDNKFKIYNWTLRFDDGTYRYYAAIQLNSVDLKLIPLYDFSHMISYDVVTDTILNNESWYGAQYYDIGSFKKGKTTYYIFLAWDGNNHISSKKLIEVMYFDEYQNVVFGAPIFKVKNETPVRFELQYNKEAFVALKFLSDKKMIVFDNLIPPSPKDSGKIWIYLPDGSYNYFKIKKGMLVFNEDIFKNEKIPQNALAEDENISGRPPKNVRVKSGVLPPE